MATANKGGQPRTPILRKNYQPPAWLVDQIEMTLKLDPEHTQVRSRLSVQRNADAARPDAALELHGVNLDTQSVHVDGRALSSDEFRFEGESLLIEGVPDQAVVETEVMIRPDQNTALEGLYAAGQSLLTQCEAEGFRKITWFPDRPDVMTRFRVRLEASRERFPILLSNGNLVDQGPLDDNHHFAEWDDPFPKPSYLFAVVAGDLGMVEDHFVTRSGRKVALKIYSERSNLSQLDHAMRSLKKSMAWDEQRFGLEYDLDVYHIVATHDFNMGAMENKSLNIFNARYVLADPDTATDADYEGVESVIAHEYFHNWTGNRVTCRDWFQLTLKEGLTVFRDQEFSGDMQSAAVSRIQDIHSLMNRQFPEDAGPMAHPIRPQRYVEINNFYTATVYEKGAEIIRMYQTLLGRDGFRRGMDLYFDRHDGQAVTCDDFLAAMADANERDLSQFSRWYNQVGTPRVEVQSEWNEAERSLQLTFEQSLIEHQDNADIGPLHIPIRMGFVSEQGEPMTARLEGGADDRPEHLVELTSQRQAVCFEGLSSRPVVSLLRDYSAPVRMDYQWSEQALALLLAHDTDPVARWLSGKRLATEVLRHAVEEIQAGNEPEAPHTLIDAWRSLLAQADQEPALTAQLLELPSEIELAQRIQPVDVLAIHTARKRLAEQLVRPLEAAMLDCYHQHSSHQPWQFDAAQIGRRRLANRCLAWMVSAGLETAEQLALKQSETADNLTDRLAAVQSLVHAGSDHAQAQLDAFEARYRTNPLVMDKWFAMQATQPSEHAVDQVAQLRRHPAFSMKNPNKVRALYASLGMLNPIAFHRADGAGYQLVADAVLELDSINPQVASRLVAVFNAWSTYRQPQQDLMAKALKQIVSVDHLSNDVGEIAEAALG